DLSQAHLEGASLEQASVWRARYEQLFTRYTDLPNLTTDRSCVDVNLKSLPLDEEVVANIEDFAAKDSSKHLAGQLRSKLVFLLDKQHTPQDWEQDREIDNQNYEYWERLKKQSYYREDLAGYLSQR